MGVLDDRMPRRSTLSKMDTDTDIYWEYERRYKRKTAFKVRECKVERRRNAVKGIIANNQMKTEDMAISAVGKVPEVAVLKGVRPAYKKDADGKRTDVIEAVRYDCSHPEEYWDFTVKVESTRPIITPELYDKAEDVIYISIPVEEVQIKPYEIAYGVAKITILAPYVKLAEN